MTAFSSAQAPCRAATPEDVDQVACIHVEAFPDFFLTQLGYRFLKVMYRAFLMNKGGVFVVYGEAGSARGFAVGALQSAERDRGLALRFLPQFVFAVLPALLRQPLTVARRLYMRFFEVGESPNVPADTAVLRSIGVLPGERGSGAAADLIDAFERQAVLKGAKKIALTTDVKDNERALKFYRKQGYSVEQQFFQDGRREMYLMLKNIEEQS